MYLTFYFWLWNSLLKSKLLRILNLIKIFVELFSPIQIVERMYRIEYVELHSKFIMQSKMCYMTRRTSLDQVLILVPFFFYTNKNFSAPCWWIIERKGKVTPKILFHIPFQVLHLVLEYLFNRYCIAQ